MKVTKQSIIIIEHNGVKLELTEEEAEILLKKLINFVPKEKIEKKAGIGLDFRLK